MIFQPVCRKQKAFFILPLSCLMRVGPYNKLTNPIGKVHFCHKKIAYKKKSCQLSIFVGAVRARKTAQNYKTKSIELRNWLKTHPKVVNSYDQRQFQNFGGLLVLSKES